MWKQNKFTQIKNVYMYPFFFFSLLHFSRFFQVNSNKIFPLPLVCPLLGHDLFSSKPMLKGASEAFSNCWYHSADTMLWLSSVTLVLSNVPCLRLLKNKEIAVVSLLGQKQPSWKQTLTFPPSYACIWNQGIFFSSFVSFPTLSRKRSKGERKERGL